MQVAAAIIAVIVVVAGVLVYTSTLPQPEEVFKFGFIPSERAEELTPKAEALADFLEEEMGMEVEVFVPTSYEPLIEGLRFENLDAAYMDSGPGWIAHQRTGAEVVLAELKKGEPFYWGEVFARSDSDLESLEDALGKRISFTSWTGSSGFIFPIGTLVSQGHIVPEGDDFVSLQAALDDSFDEYIVAGGYAQSLTLLVNGDVDVAAGAHDAPERFLDPEDRDKVKSIERLGKVPSHPVLVGEHVPDDVKERFVQAMLKLNNPENVHFLEELYGVDGLVAINTEEHLGDFGPAFESLTGIQDQVFAKTV